MFEIASTAFSFTPSHTSSFLGYMKAGLGLSWDEEEVRGSTGMADVVFNQNRERMEGLVSLYQEIFMHCTDMDNAWRIHFSVLCNQIEREASQARADYSYILDLLRKLQQNSKQGDGSSGLENSYLKSQLDAMKTTKRGMAKQMSEHSRSLLNAVKTFNELSATDEDDVKSYQKQFDAPYLDLDPVGLLGFPSFIHIRQDVQNLYDQKSDISGKAKPIITSIQLALGEGPPYFAFKSSLILEKGAWEALDTDLRLLSEDETQFEDHYDSYLSQLDLENIVASREELASRVRSLTA